MKWKWKCVAGVCRKGSAVDDTWHEKDCKGNINLTLEQAADGRGHTHLLTPPNLFLTIGGAWHLLHKGEMVTLVRQSPSFCPLSKCSPMQIMSKYAAGPKNDISYIWEDWWSCLPRPSSLMRHYPERSLDWSVIITQTVGSIITRTRDFRYISRIIHCCFTAGVVAVPHPFFHVFTKKHLHFHHINS